MSFDFTVSIPEGCLPCCNSPCGKLHAEAGGVFNGFRPFSGIDTTSLAEKLYLTATTKLDVSWNTWVDSDGDGELDLEVLYEKHYTQIDTYSGGGDGQLLYQELTYEGYHPDGSNVQWWDGTTSWKKITQKTYNINNCTEDTGYWVNDVKMPATLPDGFSLPWSNGVGIFDAQEFNETSRSSQSTSSVTIDGKNYYNNLSNSIVLSGELTFSDAEAVVKAMLDSVEMDGSYVGRGSDGKYYRLTLDDDYPNTHAGTASDPIRLQSVRIQHYPLNSYTDDTTNPPTAIPLCGNLIRVDQYNYFYGDPHFISNRFDGCENTTTTAASLVVEMGKTKAQNGRVFTETYDRGPGYCDFDEPNIPDCAEVPLGNAVSALIAADRGERIEVTVLCGGGGDNWCSQKWGLPP